MRRCPDANQGESCPYSDSLDIAETPKSGSALNEGCRLVMTTGQRAVVRLFNSGQGWNYRIAQ